MDGRAGVGARERARALRRSSRDGVAGEGAWAQVPRRSASGDFRRDGRVGPRLVKKTIGLGQKHPPTQQFLWIYPSSHLSSR
jgi:hypothetical protein